jgi:hypothetical protein
MREPKEHSAARDARGARRAPDRGAEPVSGRHEDREALASHDDLFSDPFGQAGDSGK